MCVRRMPVQSLRAPDSNHPTEDMAFSRLMPYLRPKHAPWLS